MGAPRLAFALLLLIGAGVGLLIHAEPTLAAQAVRCPGADLGAAPPPSFDYEPLTHAARVLAVYKRFGGENGPLGCPLSEGAIPGGEAWKFQHGWILDLHSVYHGFAAAAIGRREGWWVWWDGQPPKTTIVASVGLPGNIAPGQEPQAAPMGGMAQVVNTRADKLSLWKCALPCRRTGRRASLPYVQLGTELQHPTLYNFDLTSLGSDLLQDGSTAPSAVARRANLVWDFLGCYAVLPEPARDQAEDWTGMAFGMLRHSASCPLSKTSPADRIRQGLLDWQPKDSVYTGSTYDNAFCTRNADLDIALAGLLRLMYAYPTELHIKPVGAKETPFRHVLADLLLPWGGTVRSKASIIEGTCGVSGLPETENHLLLSEIDRYLINQLVADNLAAQGQAVPAKFDNAQNGTRTWLEAEMRLLARRDFFEYNALPYQRYSLEAVFLLHDYARDPALVTDAAGILDWIFAKDALASNQLRDTRPYRRRPEADRYAHDPWFDDGMPDQEAALAVLWGAGLSRLDGSATLDYPPAVPNPTGPTVDAVWGDVISYPTLGQADEGTSQMMAIAALSSYRLPPAVRSMYDDRFRSGSTFSYFQTVHHNEPSLLDPSRFLQTSDGVEIYSGTREWTISAGGYPHGAGVTSQLLDGISVRGHALAVAEQIVSSLFGPAGALVGQALVAAANSYVRDQADTTLNDSANGDNQRGIARETTIIPTSGALARSQTLRFGGAFQDPNSRSNLCVADQFACGVNIMMPSHPFPSDQGCPIPAPTGGAVAAFYAAHRSDLGCQTLPNSAPDGRFSFEHGDAVVTTQGQPLSGAAGGSFAGAWVDAKTNDIHVHWDVSNSCCYYQRFFLAAFRNQQLVGGVQEVSPSAGGRVGDFTFTTGANDKARNAGDWLIGVIGCDKDPHVIKRLIQIVFPSSSSYARVTVPDKYRCLQAGLPTLQLHVDTQPPQHAFSCAAHFSPDLPDQIGFEVGTCEGRQYGFYLMLYHFNCDSNCRPYATDYGLAVLARAVPGWTYADFAAQLAPYRKFYSGEVSTITIPDPNKPWTLTFQIAPPTSQPRLWPIISASDGRYGFLRRDTDTWPFASGTAIRGDGSGRIDVVGADGGSVKLDLSNPAQPSRVCEDGSAHVIPCG